jgi:hypothetical protein
VDLTLHAVQLYTCAPPPAPGTSSPLLMHESLASIHSPAWFMVGACDTLCQDDNLLCKLALTVMVITRLHTVQGPLCK